MNKYAFTTLAIGTNYTYKVRTLIECVLFLTKADMYVITDDPADIQEFINTAVHLDASRLTIINFNDVCSRNIWFAERMFNFNLKILPTVEAHKRGNYDMIIHADADGFLIGWEEDNFQELIDTIDAGMMARFRNRPCEEGGIHWIIDEKAKSLSIDMNLIKARMPIEVFMYFKPKHPKFAEFLNQWTEITDRCYNRGINPFIEALEISYALSEANMPHHDILPYLRKFTSLHTFRYLHHDKIMKII